MSDKGITGESQDTDHQSWTDPGGAGSSGGPSGSPLPGKTGGGLNLPTILLLGTMLAAISGAYYVLKHQAKQTTEDAEEIVFEPEVVSIDNGSVKLDAVYDADGVFGMRGQGEDEIGLTIVKKMDSTDLYDVDGTINGNQNLGIQGLDQGQPCWIDITHEIKYLVKGTFSSSKCQFELYVSVAPVSSQLLGTGCSVDLSLDPSALYLAPLPDKLVFTRSLASQTSGVYKLSLFDVSLPSGVTCPQLSNP